MDLLSERMNDKTFEVVIPEIYTKVIPKYYTGPTKSDLPRVNGIPVTMGEYTQKYQNFRPTEEFTPDMVFTPPEQNKATAMQSIADMVEMIDNDIEFAIKNPSQNYPIILEIISNYCKVLAKVASDPERARYLEKARTAGFVIEASYNRYLSRVHQTKTGQRFVEQGDAFDRIAKEFA